MFEHLDAISWANIMKNSDTLLYKALGFEKFNNGQTSYWYIEHGTYKRYHRSTFAKAGIVRRGWKDKVDNTWTE